ncbi:MAG: 3-isopropylmalate dehydratase small subunit [Thermoplasmata archaeon]|nr:3-isopropylmalate dehydratase small subunit [Thermoplasmata archaeon]
MGKVWKFGDDVNTDVIYPGYALKVTNPDEMAKYAFAEVYPEFSKEVKEGDIIVAGKNFGCGSSREQAALCLKYVGISCVIAKSFARIFYRNAINIGLPVIELKETDEINEGDELEVDLNEGILRNVTQGKEYKIKPYPEIIRRIIDAGGLINYLKEGKNV